MVTTSSGTCRPAKMRAFFAKRIPMLSPSDFHARREREASKLHLLPQEDTADYADGVAIGGPDGDMICRSLIERAILSRDAGYSQLWPEWRLIERPPLPSGREW